MFDSKNLSLLITAIILFYFCLILFYKFIFLTNQRRPCRTPASDRADVSLAPLQTPHSASGRMSCIGGTWTGLGGRKPSKSADFSLSKMVLKGKKIIFVDFQILADFQMLEDFLN